MILLCMDRKDPNHGRKNHHFMDVDIVITGGGHSVAQLDEGYYQRENAMHMLFGLTEISSEQF